MTQRLLRLSAGLALALALFGCGLIDDDELVVTDYDQQAVAEVQHVLDRRATAIKRKNEDAFLEEVSPEKFGEQLTYYRSVSQLPWRAFRYEIVADSVRSDGGKTRVQVDWVSRLKGFDSQAVRQRQLIVFQRDRNGHLKVLRSRLDEQAQRQPWDFAAIEVHREADLLGIFDLGSAHYADELMQALSAARSDVRTRLPGNWNGRAVMYALSATDFLDGLQGVPGGGTNGVDGVAFPVQKTKNPGSVVRLALNPRVLSLDSEPLARLLRHELTHVGLGSADDSWPLWLTEGVAEYISVQAIAESERAINASALEYAQGDPDRMPDNEKFSQDGATAYYGIAWFACEVIVDEYGEDALWQLGQAFEESDAPAGPKRDDAVLYEQFGIDSAELADRARARLVAKYANATAVVR